LTRARHDRLDEPQRELQRNNRARNYGSNVSATGAGGSSINRNVNATAGPQGFDRSASTTTYNAKTGQTKTWNSGTGQNSHFAGADGNAYRSDGSGGFQQHSASGWGGASGDTSWASREQQARSTASDRTSSWGGGGWDRSGSGGGDWADRFGGGADRFGGGGGSWGSRFGGGLWQPVRRWGFWRLPRRRLQALRPSTHCARGMNKVAGTSSKRRTL
jgi:hypothetical protein